MSLRIATFNVENLMNRFDLSGFGDEGAKDRALKLFQIESEADYRLLEEARALLHADDARQLTALAIADTGADIVCMQEVGNLAALKAFEYGYLYKMVGRGYRSKYMAEGNDARGIDVAVMMRDQTRDGEPIEFVAMTSHADAVLRRPGPSQRGARRARHTSQRARIPPRLPDDRPEGRGQAADAVRHASEIHGERARGCRQAACHDAGPPRRDACDPPHHRGEVRHRPEPPTRAGWSSAISTTIASASWSSGDRSGGYRFDLVREEASALDVLLEGGFSEDLVARRPAMDRWTTYYTEGPEARHLCQLDYILASPALARANAAPCPTIIRAGQPYRTVFPPGQEVERYPRTGWDRPKASDHCPVVVTLRTGLSMRDFDENKSSPSSGRA